MKAPIKRGFLIGGRGEIRTLGGVAPTPVFKTGALNHSTTLPKTIFILFKKIKKASDFLSKIRYDKINDSEK